MDEVAKLKLPVPPYDTVRLDWAASLFQQKDAIRLLKQSKLADYRPIIVSEREPADGSLPSKRRPSLRVSLTSGVA
jgi:hypothetical protein